MRFDPYQRKASYLRWKAGVATGIPRLTAANTRVIMQYLNDMEYGLNVGVGSKKGGRSYLRLSAIKTKLIFLAKLLQDRYQTPLVTDAGEETLHRLFSDMRTGVVRRRDGQRYLSTGDYVKTFKAFWNWHRKVQKKNGAPTVSDICIDLDTSCDKPLWVYLTQEQVRRLMDHAKFDYKVLISFLYDSGIRSPTELLNVRVEDISPDGTQLTIREESSKTFGRTVKLLLCNELIRRYAEEEQLAASDRLFTKAPGVINRYLKRLSLRVLGTAKSPGGAPYSDLTMYDFRHSSACYWLPRYKSEAALKYRFGWKKSRMIHYYTNFLGMRDTITSDDLILEPEKAAIDRDLRQATVENGLLKERLATMERQMEQIHQSLVRVAGVVGVTPSGSHAPRDAGVLGSDQVGQPSVQALQQL